MNLSHDGQSHACMYTLLCIAINRLVMPVKKRPAGGAIPDCRPVGVPQPDRCCIERAVAKTAEEAGRQESPPAGSCSRCEPS